MSQNTNNPFFKNEEERKQIMKIISQIYDGKVEKRKC